MSSKYFGEFLVEKGVITQDNLVDALIEQITTTPPLCKVIFDKRILPVHKIFEAFRFQQDHQVEFIQACKELGVWTQDIQDKSFAAMDEIRKPLGHILVNKGLIDLKKLTSMLDEFLSQLAIAPKEAPPVNTAPAPVKEEQIVVAPVQGISTEKLLDIEITELNDTFDEKKRKMIRVALSMVKDNAQSDPAICKKLIQDVFKIVHSLSGLLSLLSLEKLPELFAGMEDYLNKIQANLSERSGDDLLKDAANLTEAIDMAWNLRLSVLSNSTEAVYFSETNNKNQFEQLIKTLKG